MELAAVTEGATTFLVPSERAGDHRGPGAAGSGFYNPAMALTRDVSVLAAHALRPPHGATFLDGLSATGARGLRVAVEAPGWQVTLNDRDPRAAAILARNVQRLGLDARVEACDLNALASTERWWHVELDPYGSPVPFLAGCVRAVKRGGTLSVSATDTSALHGVRPQVARRRYRAEPPPREAPGWKAAAARLLVGAITRTAAQFDLAATPLFAFQHQHAFRATLRIGWGAGRADDALAQVRPMVLCSACRTWGQDRCACGEGEPSGPYWMGPLQDREAAEGMVAALEAAALAEPRATRRLVEGLAGEASLGPLYLHVPEAASLLGVDPPSRERLVEALAEVGIRAQRSVFDPEALAHDGEAGEVLKVIEALGREP